MGATHSLFSPCSTTALGVKPVRCVYIGALVKHATTCCGGMCIPRVNGLLQPGTRVSPGTRSYSPMQSSKLLRNKLATGTASRGQCMRV